MIRFKKNPRKKMIWKIKVHSRMHSIKILLLMMLKEQVMEKEQLWQHGAAARAAAKWRTAHVAVLSLATAGSSALPPLPEARVSPLRLASV